MPTSKAESIATKQFPKVLPATDVGKSPSELIDARINELQDWRGEFLSHLRVGANPEVTEEWKWNVPVWSCNGIICTGEAYKSAVKLTFAKGALLDDPSKLFNSSLEGKVRRAIDFAEGTRIDEAALSALIRAGVNLNKAAVASKPRSAV
jgi:hypothetical protein